MRSQRRTRHEKPTSWPEKLSSSSSSGIRACLARRKSWALRRLVVVSLWRGSSQSSSMLVRKLRASVEVSMEASGIGDTPLARLSRRMCSTPASKKRDTEKRRPLLGERGGGCSHAVSAGLVPRGVSGSGGGCSSDPVGETLSDSRTSICRGQACLASASSPLRRGSAAVWVPPPSRTRSATLFLISLYEVEAEPVLFCTEERPPPTLLPCLARRSLLWPSIWFDFRACVSLVRPWLSTSLLATALSKS
mmetsp:Transcript_105104/g.307129  ORF Transcript_105104/g.307129 Transcript_105104/m.307129 type:complete len:249 (+) Transcript_105104:859-1605(+)